MPNFIVTSPEGKKFKITAPEGASQDEVLSYAQSKFTNSSNPKPQTFSPSPLAMGQEQNIEPSGGLPATLAEKALQGATFGWGDELYNRGGAAIASLATGEPYNKLLEEAKLRTKQRQEQQSSQYPLTSMVSEFAGSIPATAALLGNAPAAKIASKIGSGTLANVTKGALGGAATGALYGAGAADENERGENALLGAAFGAPLGAAFPVASEGVSYLKNAIAPEITKGAERAIIYAMKHNVPLRLDQVTPGMARKYMQSASSRIPASEGVDFDELQQKAFNRAVLKSVAVNADKVTPGIVKKAYDTIGKKFELPSKERIKMSDEQFMELAKLYYSLPYLLSKPNGSIIKANIYKVLENFDADGYITGAKINDLRSDLSTIVNKIDDKLKPYVHQILDNVIDIAVEGSKTSKDRLREARYQYKNIKTLEPLFAKAENGNIRPTLLLNEVKTSYGDKALATDNAGELGELVQVANLLKRKVGDSGTAERAIAYSTLGAPGALLGFATTPGDFVDRLKGAAITGGGALLAGRQFNKYNTNPANIIKAIERSKLPPSEKTDLLGKFNKMDLLELLGRKK